MKYSGLPIVTSAGPTGFGSVTSLNAAPSALKVAFCFIAEESDLSCFWIRIGTSAGADANRKVTFALQADSAGIASGVDIKSYEQIGGFSAANTQVQINPGWSGSNMTIGSRYWMVISNTSAAPATDYIQVTRASIGNNPPQSTNYNTIFQMGFRGWNGTNWTTTIADSLTTLTIKFASGALVGLRCANATSYDVNWLISPTRAVGIEFKVPQGAIWNVNAMSMYVNSSPKTKLNVYSNRQLIATSGYADSLELSNRVVCVPISCRLSPGTTVAVMTDAMTSSSGQPMGDIITNHADFLSMKPFNGTARRVKLENGTTWTTDDLVVPSLTISLDQRQPFINPPLNRRKYFNQR